MKPATILAWFRALSAGEYDSSAARKLGRPLKTQDVRKLVRDSSGVSVARAMGPAAGVFARGMAPPNRQMG